MSVFRHVSKSQVVTGELVSEDSLGYNVLCPGMGTPRFLLKSCFTSLSFPPEYSEEEQQQFLDQAEFGDIVQLSVPGASSFGVVLGKQSSGVLPIAPAVDLETAQYIASNLLFDIPLGAQPCTWVTAGEFAPSTFILLKGATCKVAAKYSDIEHWFTLDPVTGGMVEVTDPDELYKLLEERKCAICGEPSAPDNPVQLHHIIPRWLAREDPSVSANEGMFMHWGCAHSDLSAADMTLLGRTIQEKLKRKLGPEAYSQRMRELAQKEHQKRRRLLGDEGYKQDQVGRLTKTKDAEVLDTLQTLIKQAQVEQHVHVAAEAAGFMVKFLWDAYHFMARGYQHFITPTHADPHRRYTYNEGVFLRSNLRDGTYLFMPHNSAHFEQVRKDWEAILKSLRDSLSHMSAIYNVLAKSQQGQEVIWQKTHSVAKTVTRDLQKIPQILEEMEQYLESIPIPYAGNHWYLFGFGKPHLMTALRYLIPGATYVQQAIELLHKAKETHDKLTTLESTPRSPFGGTADEQGTQTPDLS